MKIWGLLSTIEQEKLLHLSNPSKFAVGNWVKDKSTEELHQVKDKRFDSKEKIWFYVVEGEKEFEEQHLEISLDYAGVDFENSI
jgi:hypothetical protein